MELIAQINEMVIEWRNEGNDALDYDEQQANKDVMNSKQMKMVISMWTES